MKPVAATRLRLRPGERYDVLVDFSGDAEGAEVVLGFRELEHGEVPYQNQTTGPVARSSRGRGGGTNQGRTLFFNSVNATFGRLRRRDGLAPAHGAHAHHVEDGPPLHRPPRGGPGGLPEAEPSLL